MRIVQVSDTHLSATLEHFQGNVDKIALALGGLKPALFIHTGDVSMDGVRVRKDLEVARDWNALLPAPVLSLPGNHDVGDLATIRADQQLNDERLAVWRDVIGPDWWSHDLGGWQLIGLNAMLFGTGHLDEGVQFEWLASILQSERPIAVFLHKPLCVEDIDEGPCGYWTVAPQPRARLMALLAARPVKMIASGHVHVERQRVVDGVDHVWCPAASFVVGASQEDLGGEARIGYAVHDFGADRVVSRFVHPDGVEALELDAVRDEIYPD